MADSAKNVSQQTEDRLSRVAESVRKKFDRITAGGFTDKIKNGRFADQVDHGVDQGRREARQRKQDGPER
ncbi:hypothetical protein [Micromonospora psammae]|uniref:hypothetical protein n=1 Tax=Micromonospora sp. CPCC 205556 TaxID=3122398 RepID=UPI002FEFD23F